MSYNPTSIIDDPVYSTHNVTPSNLRFVRAALAAARAGTRDARFLFVGDSITAATTATVARTGNYAARMSAILSAHTGIASRRGAISIDSFGTRDPQWTVGTGWSGALSVLGSGTGAYSSAAGNANSMDFAPTDDAGTSIQCDSFIVYAYAGGSAGSFQWAIDGGSYTTQTVSGSTGINAFTVSAGSLGTHTLHIKTLASGNQPYVMGAEAVNSTSHGIRWMATGQSGQTVSGMVSSGEAPQTIKAIAPDLVGVLGGTNNYTAQTALTTFQSALQTEMASIQAMTRPADILWITWPPQQSALTIPQSSYFSTVDAAADIRGVPVLHLDRQMVSYAVSNASPMLLMGDAVHPNDAGFNFIGNSLAALFATLA